MADNQNQAELDALMAQRREIDAKIGNLSADPNHPVLKPVTSFSEGEEVTVTVDGNTASGKVVKITGDPKAGFTYDVVAAVTVSVAESALRKAGA